MGRISSLLKIWMDLSLLVMMLMMVMPECKSQKNMGRMPKVTHGSVEDRVAQLVELSERRAVIRLNAQRFATLIGSKASGQPARNYSIIVMLTALNPQRGCQLCRPAADQFALVASSHRYSATFQPNLFFALVDFDEAPEVFNEFAQDTAPAFYLFETRERASERFSKKQADTMDLSRSGFAAEKIAEWIAAKTSISIHVIHPPNHTPLALTIIGLVLLATLFYLRRDDLDFLYNRTAWAVVSLAFVLIFTSGYMWTVINRAPLANVSPKGGVSFFHSSSRTQYGAETWFVAAINGATTLGFILLIQANKAQHQPMPSNAQTGKKHKQRTFMMSAVGLGLVAIAFSIMLSIFRSKSYGYPYRLLFP